MNEDHEHRHDYRYDHGQHNGSAHAPHPTQPDDASPPGRYEVMILAMRDLLIEKGAVTAEQIRRGFEILDSWQPSRGAQVVARAWKDPAFKRGLLEDGNAAVADFGIKMGETKLIVVENTQTVQNVIVCTLCSCYPRALLGLPPDWYRSKSYRSRVVVDPRQVLRELGTELPDNVTIRVHDSLADLRYLVLPRRPDGTEGWSEVELASIISRDCMIGVANPKVPASEST
jgi:nitrile hydratase alpha subunit